jgi:hypothetical protein
LFWFLSSLPTLKLLLWFYLLWFGAAATKKPTLSTGRVLKLGCKREMISKGPYGLYDDGQFFRVWRIQSFRWEWNGERATEFLMMGCMMMCQIFRVCRMQCLEDMCLFASVCTIMWWRATIVFWVSRAGIMKEETKIFGWWLGCFWFCSGGQEGGEGCHRAPDWCQGGFSWMVCVCHHCV